VQGRADFYVPAKEWGVELLCDGDQLAEHLGRFSQAHQQNQESTYFTYFTYFLITAVYIKDGSHAQILFN
jgi:hypothetical protein